MTNKIEDFFKPSVLDTLTKNQTTLQEEFDRKGPKAKYFFEHPEFDPYVHLIDTVDFETIHRQNEDKIIQQDKHTPTFHEHIDELLNAMIGKRLVDLNVPDMFVDYEKIWLKAAEQGIITIYYNEQTQLVITVFNINKIEQTQIGVQLKEYMNENNIKMTPKEVESFLKNYYDIEDGEE